MASLQILGPFTSCYHTCKTDPSFVIGSCQVRFVVLIFDHSGTSYSALNGTHVPCEGMNLRQSWLLISWTPGPGHLHFVLLVSHLWWTEYLHQLYLHTSWVHQNHCFHHHQKQRSLLFVRKFF